MVTLPYVLATLLAVGGGIELAQFDQQLATSSELKPGDGEVRVLKLLGEPNMRCPHGLTLFTNESAPPQWIYGTNIDCTKIIDTESAFPNPLPVKFRIFSPDQSDLVINWNDKGQVASIQRPEPISYKK